MSQENKIPFGTKSTAEESGSTILLHVQSWSTLGLSLKKDQFFSLVGPTSLNERYSALSQLEAAYDGGELSTTDFCFLIRMSECLSFSIHLLRTRPETPILLSALHVFRVHWCKTSRTLDELLVECGGPEGLVEILASLPLCVAVKLIRILGGRGRKDKDTDYVTQLRTQTVDFIISAAIPSLNSEPNPPSPIRRLASVILHWILPAASESLLRSLIPRFEGSIPPKTWKNLALRHPILVSQLIFIQFDADETVFGDTWADGGILEHPRNLFPAVLLLSQTKKAGKDFLWKCVASYAFHIHKGNDVAHGRDIFGGLHSSALSELAFSGLTARLLRERHKECKDMRYALEILDVLTIIRGAEGKHEWEWDQVLPVLDCAIAEFSRHREEWLLPLDSQKTWISTGGTTATMILYSLFKDLKTTSLSHPPTSFLSSLQRLPKEARHAFWTIAFFIRFSLDLTDEGIIPPPLSPSLLYILGHSHGESILRRGIEAHGSTFLSAFHVPIFSQPDAYVLGHAFNTTIPANVGNEHCTDAQRAVMHAAWLGSDIKRWEDLRHPRFKSGLEEVEHDVSSFKRLAAGARTGPERLAYLKVVFAIIFPTRHLDLLDDTLTWMAKRFARDPDAGIGMWNWLVCGEYRYYTGDDVALLTVLSGPLVKRLHKDTSPDSYVDDLRQYFHSAGKVLRTLRMFLELLAVEPGRAVNQMWQRYGAFLEKVIQERTQLISGFPDALVKHTDLRGAVYEDLSPLILSHGPHPVPVYIGNSDLLVPRRLWNVVIPWVDDLGAEVEDLYRGAYGSATEDTSYLPFRDQTFWPIRTILSTNLQQEIVTVGHVDFDITSTHYYKHIESWLFGPHSVLLAEPADIFDRYHGRQRVQQYIEDYLTFSQDQEEVSAKVLRLLSHYGPENPSENTEEPSPWKDHSLIILGIKRVREELGRSPEFLQIFIDKLLPQYSQSNEPTKIVWHDPLAHMPEVPTVDQGCVLGYSAEKLTEADRIHIFESLLQDILTPKNTAISPHNMERLAFFAVAHISTFNRIPSFEGPEGRGPVSHALRYFRLKNLKVFGGDNGTSPERLLEQSLPFVSASELKRLINAITALPLTDRTRKNIVALLDVLRRYHDPVIAVDLAFYVLADVESSSWHRQMLVRSLLRVLKPVDALSVMDRFLEFLADRRREQLGLPIPNDSGDSVAVGEKGEDGGDTKAVLKISTIKMFLQLLNAGIEDGVFSGDMYHIVHRVMDISSHPSVSEAAIDVFVRAISTLGVTSAPDTTSTSRDDGLYAHFSSFVRIGGRLAEKVDITDEEWDAVLRGDAPMPIIDSSHFIATALLKVRLDQFPPGPREMWIEEVLVPLLCSHVANRTKWLKAALSREGGSGEEVALIHGSFDAKFDVARCFRIILDCSLDGPTKKCRDALLPIIEQRIRILFSRQSFEALSRLAQAKNRADEEAQTYLKDVRLLTAHALENQESNFNGALSTIVHGIKIPHIKPVIIAELSGVVERIGTSLLAPENILIGHDPRKKTPPLSCFLGMLQTLWPLVGSLGDPLWSTRIRPLLVSFMNRAVELEREQSQMSHNGGACYWPVIISLKVLLLPLPILSPYNSAPDRAEKYVEALTGLAKEVSHYPGHRRLLPEYFLGPITSTLRCAFEDVLPICRLLTSLPQADTGAHDLRLLCFEIANFLIRSFSVEFKDNPKDEALRDEMLTAWSNDSDGMVRWMTLQFVA